MPAERPRWRRQFEAESSVTQVNEAEAQSSGEMASRDTRGFVSLTVEEAANRLRSGPQGLTEEEARKRLELHGPNRVSRRGHPGLWILFRQFRNPLLALLLAAASVSFAVGERLDATIVIVILALSVSLGFYDEYRADRSARLLESHLTRTARVVREGAVTRIPADEVVPGDLLVVEIGDIVAADARLIEATDLSADEAIMTGESLPVDKSAEVSPDERELFNTLLAGTVIRSGRGRGLVVATGEKTLLGGISASMKARRNRQSSNAAFGGSRCSWWP